ncbi:hypothetical protein WKI13_14780 [Teredinibacter turnerae]|uniref:hypothetical protein n=1 Tax=Teredinibacter turnerae TaxID=2426 RepID=UPI000371F5C6|nr:hypothetical protein [Teredinibacter turnerae]
MKSVIYINSYWHLKCFDDFFDAIDGDVIIVCENKVSIDSKLRDELEIIEISKGIKNTFGYFVELKKICRYLRKVGPIRLYTFVDKVPIVQAICHECEVKTFTLLEEGVGLYYDGKDIGSWKKKILRSVTKILYWAFFKKLYRSTFKEQGKSVAGDVLVCRYPECLPKITKKNYTSIVVFDVYSLWRGEYHDKNIYFIGCDFNALGVRELEKDAVSDFRIFAESIGRLPVYLCHPRMKSYTTDGCFGDLRIASLDEVKEIVKRPVCVTLASGAILDAWAQGGDCYLHASALSKSLIYSAFFKKLFSSIMNQKLEGDNFIKLQKFKKNTPIYLKDVFPL